MSTYVQNIIALSIKTLLDLTLCVCLYVWQVRSCFTARNRVYHSTCYRTAEQGVDKRKKYIENISQHCSICVEQRKKLNTNFDYLCRSKFIAAGRGRRSRADNVKSGANRQ